LLATDEEPEARAERGDLNDALRRGLQEIPPDQRATLVLSDIHGLSYEEIARATRVSVGTVKSRLSRARAKLRDYMLAHEELLPGRYRPTVNDS